MESGRLARRTLLVAAAGLPLSGCSAVRVLERLAGANRPASSPGAGSSPTGGVPGLDAVAERLQAAADAQDVEAFVAQFAPSAQAQARTIADNLTRLASVAFSGVNSALSVQWRGGPEKLPQSFATQVVRDDDGRLSSVGGTGSNGALPPWWLTPCEVRHAGQVTMVTARSQLRRSGPWLESADRAVQHLVTEDLGSLREDWDGRLLVVVPGDVLDFEDPDAAAYALPATVEDGPVVWLNPDLLDDDDTAWQVGLFAHEGVHAIANELVDTAPLWAEEGLAEMVAENTSADYRAYNDDVVVEAATWAMPTDLPTRNELEEGDVEAAYALAAFAVRTCFGRWGRPTVLGWFRDTQALADHLPEMREAYLAELRRRRGR